MGPLRRMTDEDRMNSFADTMVEEDLSFLSFPSLPSSSFGSPSTTQEQHDPLLLPSSSLPTIFNLSPRTTLAPRGFALPELQLMKSRSLYDDEDSDSDSDDDDVDVDLTPPLLQTCRSFDSDIDDDNDNDFDVVRQRARAQSPLKTLPILQMRKNTSNNNQSLSENSK